MVEPAVMSDGEATPAELLGRRVRQLREAAGLTVTELGRQAAVSQPMVSRVETGVVLPSVDLLNRIADVLGLKTDVRGELVALYSHAAQDIAGRRGRAAGVAIVDGMVKREREAQVVRCFQTAMIPALLQTDEYATAATNVTPWLALREAASVAARQAQRRAVLDRPGGDFRFVLAQSALASWPGEPSVIVGQFEALAQVVDHPSVSFGLLPNGPRVRRLPLCGFTLYDDTSVSIETFTGELLLTDGRDIDVYRSVFDDFAAEALYGDAMRAVLDQAAGAARRAAARVTGTSAE
jgi:DNA-binding XRE family transcriptional regulator